MRDQQGFNKTIAWYLKKGIMRMIYSSDAHCVLNVADSFYIASDYTKGAQGYVAFLVNSKMIRAMLVDSAFLERMLTTYDRTTLSRLMFYLTDSTFRHFAKNGKNNPTDGLSHRFVDHELERWIQETFGAAQSPQPGAGEKTGRTVSLRRLFRKSNESAR